VRVTLMLALLQFSWLTSSDLNTCFVAAMLSRFAAVGLELDP